MRRTKKNGKKNHYGDTYEESLRLEKLDAYESLIQSNLFQKKKDVFVE